MNSLQLPVTSFRHKDWRIRHAVWRYQLPARRGVTLMELVVASTVSLVVVLAVGQLDVTRIFLAEQARQSAGMGSEARLAMSQFVRDAQQADRVNVVSGTNVQLRIPQADCDSCACSPDGVPEPSCFNDSASYRWVQYKLDSTQKQILFYDDTASGCGAAADRTFHDIKSGGFSVRYRDTASVPAPPGGEPFAGEDNNVLDIQVTTADSSGQAMTYVNTVTLRAGAYTNVGAGGGDSGLGLDVQGVSALPGTC